MRGSLWIETAGTTSFPRLEEDVSCDVAVVGGGVAGLSTALLLQLDGYEVVLLDADGIGLGATANATVKLAVNQGLRYAGLERAHGSDTAKAYARANLSGLVTIRDLVQGHEIDCGLENRAHYVCAETDEELAAVHEEITAAVAAGLPASFAAAVDLPFDVAGAMVLHDQAQVHPRRYLLGLADALVLAGGRIFEHTRASDVIEEDACMVQTEHGKVNANDVLVATHFPTENRGLLFAKMLPQQEYAVCGPIATERPPKDMYISAGSGWSVRTYDRDGQTLVIVVGEKHRVGEGGDTESHYSSLTDWARERFGVAEISYRWTTHDLWPIDGLPYVGRIGETDSHVYVSTGFGGWGMTNATVGANVVHDLIRGLENPFAGLYSPLRSDLVEGAGGLAKNAASTAVHWLGDRLRGSTDIDDIGPGEGAVLKRDGEYLAVSRDESGAVSAVSAVCTHLGCLVRWNGAEKSWDCPCHGSRFAANGEVIAAPAVAPLSARILAP